MTLHEIYNIVHTLANDNVLYNDFCWRYKNFTRHSQFTNHSTATGCRTRKAQKNCGSFCSRQRESASLSASLHFTGTTVSFIDFFDFLQDLVKQTNKTIGTSRSTRSLRRLKTSSSTFNFSDFWSFSNLFQQV